MEQNVLWFEAFWWQGEAGGRVPVAEYTRPKAAECGREGEARGCTGGSRAHLTSTLAGKKERMGKTGKGIPSIEIQKGNVLVE